MKAWKITLGVLGLLIIGAIALSVHQDHQDEDEDGRIYLERRHDYVRILQAKMPAGTMTLAGANDDVLVLDLTDCGPHALRRLLDEDQIVVRLMEARFTKLRCRDSGIEVTVPRQP